MARTSLVAGAVDTLLARILAGEHPAGQPLPAQADLAGQLGVSRLTVREALETLRERGVVRIVHGRGTFVAPVEEWTDVDAISLAVGRSDPAGQVAGHILEVRRMIEVGAAGLCASRRSEEDADELDALTAAMRAADAAGDVDAFVTHDMAFHTAVLRGCGNPFLPVVYDPLMRALREARTQTSLVPQIRRHAIAWHAAIAEAVRRGDPDAARAAMTDHMDQTRDDLARYVLRPE